MPHGIRPLGFALVLAAFSSANLYADVIDFENLPAANLFFSGDQNIGMFYSGVDFESNVTGLDLTGSTAFPPHSGSIVVWDPVDASVMISFTTAQDMVGVWYTSLDPLTLDAFVAPSGTGALLGLVIGAANTDGTSGTSDFLSFSGSGRGIESITLTGNPGNFVFDDLTFSPGIPAAVPEPSSLALFVTAFFGMALVLGRRGISATPPQSAMLEIGQSALQPDPSRCTRSH